MAVLTAAPASISMLSSKLRSFSRCNAVCVLATHTWQLYVLPLRLHCCLEVVGCSCGFCTVLYCTLMYLSDAACKDGDLIIVPTPIMRQLPQ